MRLVRVLGAVLLLCLLTLPCWAAEPVVSDWAELYVRDAQGIYGILDEPPENLTAPIPGEAFAALLGNACDFLSERYEAVPYEGPMLSAAEITREAAAVRLSDVVQALGIPQLPGEFPVADEAEISPDAREAIRVVYAAGLMLGEEENRFAPKRALTWEEAATISIRLIHAWPYLDNKTEVADGVYMQFNSFYYWLENDSGRMLAIYPNRYGSYGYRPDWGIEYVRFFPYDESLILLTRGSFAPEEEDATCFVDAYTGEVFLRLPYTAGSFQCMSADGRYLIFYGFDYSEPGVDNARTVYAVYSVDGDVLLPMGATMDEVRAAGYLP